MYIRLLLATALAVSSGHSASAQTQLPVRLQYLTGGLSNPVDVAAPPGDDRLFVAEQIQGRVRIVDATGTVLPTPFLTLGSNFLAGGERGLLGLCFHPEYEANGYFFVSYTDAQGDLVFSRFSRASGSQVLADPTSEVVLMHLLQPFPVHKGADMAFGPDGFLYVSTGDGGGSGDGTCRPQEFDVLHGKILRIDVDAIDATGTYAIPPDNPLVGVPGARPEILHGGLRNPWRFCIDSLSGDLWIGDVGQTKWEEINWADADERLVNFGWKTMEGPDCFPSPGCQPSAGYIPCGSSQLRLPLSSYTHIDGCAVIGGQVYRGAAIPAMHGWYLYADFCSGKFWAALGYEGALLDLVELTAQLQASASYSSPTAISLDGFGEVVMSTIGGDLYRLVPEPASPEPVVPLFGDVDKVSIGSGGVQTLDLDGGPLRGGHFYFMVGSATGVHPGVPVDSMIVPIQVDAYTLDLLGAAAPPLSQVFGILDGLGRDQVFFDLPAGAVSPALAGLELHHAFVVFGRTFGLEYTSNAVSLELTP